MIWHRVRILLAAEARDEWKWWSQRATGCGDISLSSISDDRSMTFGYPLRIVETFFFVMKFDSFEVLEHCYGFICFYQFFSVTNLISLSFSHFSSIIFHSTYLNHIKSIIIQFSCHQSFIFHVHFLPRLGLIAVKLVRP